MERFGLPGKTLLGSDSHTPTGGGIGMFAVGAGGLDVAFAMAQGGFSVAYPNVVRVELVGSLKPWVSAKDVILKMLEMLTTKGNVGTVIEYGGPGVASLSVPERATITNMGAELGVTTSLFPSDRNTFEFLKAQGRESGFVELFADPDATYYKRLTLNLSDIEPLAAKPHSPDNVASVRSLKGVRVDQVAVGSCTNSSFRDLMMAAKMVEGRKVKDSVSFIVAPGSKQVLRMIADNGAFSTLLAAGARFAENVCGFCIGNSLSPGTAGVSLRTSNRNFEGRSGTPSAQVYLVSVETAVASALTGEFTDPRTLGLDCPSFQPPERFTLDDSMIALPLPLEKRGEVRIVRGPNIGEPPSNTPLSDSLQGVVAIKVGDKITTDHIMPAGDKLKYRSNIPAYSEFVFAGVDPAFSGRAMENKRKGIASIIVAGLSYGQGSSREHAAICPMYLGVKVVVARSFERIHTANLINFGILPFTFADPSDYDKIDRNDVVELPDIRARLLRKETVELRNRTKGIGFSLVHSLTDKQIDILLAGGKLNLARR
ncbi:MAG: aconitate hydratase [Elusimicrobia bacterium RIFOXYB2_FULL_49_7]|nr:MAG: aconitate hydratase [Elusimicrobia bacterium RIFOXYB2_FULL_49_7]